MTSRPRAVDTSSPTGGERWEWSTRTDEDPGAPLELHLLVCPLTRGPGPRLFPEDAAPVDFSLAACEAFENSVVYLNYRV